jgi:hypothetical protein
VLPRLEVRSGLEMSGPRPRPRAGTAAAAKYNSGNSAGLMVESSLSLEGASNGASESQNMIEMEPLTTAATTAKKGVGFHTYRIHQWKTSPFAVGFTEPTWTAERYAMGSSFPGGSPSYGGGFTDNEYLVDARTGQPPINNNHQVEYPEETNTPDHDDDLSEDDDEGVDPEYSNPAYVSTDSTGCLCCSAIVCHALGAQRVGNMSVLYSTTEWVEEDVVVKTTPSTSSNSSGEGDDDLPKSPPSKRTRRRYARPKLHVVLGPYWPMLLFVTYPLILIASLWTFWSGIYTKSIHPLLALVWFLSTATLMVSLALTGCRDPGILYRHRRPPSYAAALSSNWRWNDKALTYRPRSAVYDDDTAVVVEEFDHTYVSLVLYAHGMLIRSRSPYLFHSCPWTGTAIGRKNMGSFQVFVCFVFVCLLLDILIITGSMDGTRHVRRGKTP